MRAVFMRAGARREARARAMRRRGQGARLDVGSVDPARGCRASSTADSASTFSITSAMSVKRRRPSRNASTAISLAALSAAGAVPPRRDRLARRAARRGSARVEALELELAQRGEVERLHARLDALGPGERAGDGRAHVGGAQLRDHASRRGTRPSSGSRSADAPRPRSPRAARRRASAPRSPRGPCSSSWPSPPRSCGPSPSWDARRPARASRARGAPAAWCGTARPRR